MVHNCAILSCPLHNRRNIRKGLLFHSFPVDQHRFELWRQTVLKHCSRTLSINKHSKICHRHFRPDDYIANHTGLTRYLKATAIPSIFTDIQSHPSMLHSSVFHTYSADGHPNRSIHLTGLPETSSSSPILLPSKSSSPALLPTITNTKTKRLLNTIEKLHQIQNANKIVMTHPLAPESEPTKENEARNILVVKSPVTHNPTGSDHPLLSAISIAPAQQCPNQQEGTLIQSQSKHAEGHWKNTTMNSSPHNHLEDALYKFLQHANLLQYYSAFLEQGGDDLKQLAEAQNDDFQEIITLVGMVSKPLHVKRFKKALADYRHGTHGVEGDPTPKNNSPLSVPLRRLSTGEILSERLYPSPLIAPKPISNPAKLLDTKSSHWSVQKLEHGSTHQFIDDNQRKLIADEAERLANLLPITSIRKINGQPPISKDLFTTMNLPRDFEDRWQRIRKFSAIYNRFDSKQPERVMTLHEVLINEAAAAICFHRPEFLMRREELLHLARRILQNIGITHGTATNSKRPLSMSTPDSSAAKQAKLNIPIVKPLARQRDPDAFRLMWRNREAKLGQIPIEIEELRYEQNKLLQQLKQNTIDPSISADNTGLKKQIDDLGKRIEQLSDEERNLRRLIRKRNMRLRAKERQQQKQLAANHSSTNDLSAAPLGTSLSHDPPTSESNNNNRDGYSPAYIKNEKIVPTVHLPPCADLKAEKGLFLIPSTARPIDRRREEVIEQPIPTLLHPYSVQRKRSSSATTLELAVNSVTHSSVSTNLFLSQPGRELTESKIFISKLDINTSVQRETNE